MHLHSSMWLPRPSLIRALPRHPAFLYTHRPLAMLPPFSQMGHTVFHWSPCLPKHSFLSPWRALICPSRLNLHMNHHLQEAFPGNPGWVDFSFGSPVCLMLKKSLSNEWMNKRALPPELFLLWARSELKSWTETGSPLIWLLWVLPSPTSYYSAQVLGCVILELLLVFCPWPWDFSLSISPSDFTSLLFQAQLQDPLS